MIFVYGHLSFECYLSKNIGVRMFVLGHLPMNVGSRLVAYKYWSVDILAFPLCMWIVFSIGLLALAHGCLSMCLLSRH